MNQIVMMPLKLILLYHTRRQCTTRDLLGFSKSAQFLGFNHNYHTTRLLSESLNKNDNTLSQIPLIKPVSYSVKGEEKEFQRFPPPQVTTTDSEQQQQQPQPQNDNESRAAWTKQDFRYVKDSPSISYPTLVAPLPEDRVAPPTGDQGGDKRENDLRLLKMMVRLPEKQKIAVPFPTLFTLGKNKAKVVLDLKDAIKKVKANARAKFDETVEAHVNLGIDPRRSDQTVKGAATLPHGIGGKVIRIAVFAEGAAAEEARAAGADIVGGDELIEEIIKGLKITFDKCITTPTFMPRVAKLGKILGPRDLMPNPKLGSVTSDVTGALRAAKLGRVDFKSDKTGIVHVGLGKVSFTEESLRENVGAFVNALLLAKPVGLKKTSKYAGYVNSFSLCCTMGPGFPVSVQSLSMAADHYNKLQLK